MKPLLMPVSLALSALVCPAAPPDLAPVASGPHHAVFRWTEPKTFPDGTVTQEPHGYVAVATGMNHWRDGAWTPSEEVIELLRDGAAALRGQMNVVFAPNLNTPDAIVLILPDGQRLSSRVAGLAYTDRLSGKSSLIATVREDCTGELHPPNQVIYPEAFTIPGIDVVCVYTLAGFAQDIVIRNRDALPDPVEVGIAPENALLEVWTAFLDAASPVRLPGSGPRAASIPGAELSADETLDFGSMCIGPGRAFTLPEDPDPEAGLPVQKTWLQQPDGLQFLIESVPYPAVRERIDSLRQAAAPIKRDTALIQTAPARQTLMAQAFPAERLRRTSTRTGDRIRLANLPPPREGFVLDYRTLIGSLTNYTFTADMTFLVSGATYLYGPSNVLEGGTVIKYAPSAGATLCVKGALLSRTDDYRVAILTARNDSSVGESIGSSPSGAYAAIALDFDYAASSVLATQQHLRIAYAATAIRFNGGSGHDLSHVQVFNCGTAVKADNASYALRNVLGWNLTNAATGSGSAAGVWEHATLDQVTNLASGVTLALTNSLLTGVASTNGLAGASNVVLGASNGVYQVVGGGRHYLAENSPYRDCGVTNINPALAAALTRRTTYAPLVLTGLVSSATLGPVAARDLGNLDVGFYYAPLDYWSCGAILGSNVTLRVVNGAAIGLDYVSNSWGFVLKSARFVSEGAPNNLNRLVRAHMVQEQGGGNPGTRACFYDGLSANAACEIRLRHTEFAQLPNDGYFLYSGTKLGALEFSHARVWDPALVVDTAGGASFVIGITNTLWERGGAQIGLATSSANTLAHLQNNLWRRFYLHVFDGKTNWSFRNNLVDTAYANDHSKPLVNSHNSYYQSTNLMTGGWSNATLASLSYERGPLGDYYQPTNSALLNTGSTNAHLLGLYHFTTTTNQAKETNSMADRGLHYVAVDANGQPVDTDGDGVPDYLEDTNGNGATDGAEANWNQYDSPNGLSVGSPLQVFTPLK